MSKNKVKKITDFSVQKAPVKKVKETPVSEQVTAFDTAEVWVTEHWKLALGILCGILAVIVIAVIAAHIRSANDMEARQAIAAAQDVAALENVLQTYPDHPGIVNASVRLAGLYQAEKNYPKAYEVLKAVADNPSAELFFRTRALIDCAGILELQGKNADAVKLLENVINDMSAEESQRAEAAYTAARLSADIKDTANAERFLGVIVLSRAEGNRNDPYTFWASKAQELKIAIAAPAATPAPAEPAAK